MEQQSITTTRTARYFTMGELNEHTKEVWIVLHGFAQLASHFILKFESLQDTEKFIVAPEALNRFYTKGYTGNVGATWLTKEARLDDIKDNNRYLDNLIAELRINRAKTKILVLGFSQGVATLTRWLSVSKFIPDCIVLFAGEIAYELQKKPLPNYFYQTKSYMIYGTQDPLLPSFAPDSLSELFADSGTKILTFEGKHEINVEILKQVEF